MLARSRDEPALPQGSDDVDRLLEHLATDRDARPAVSEDVLVEVLSRADAEEEAAGHHGRGRGGGLRDERGMDARRRTRHRGAETESIRRRRDAADHAPHERALALSVGPGM